MPLQNRVTPWSEIVVSSARGLFMGNRGVLHDGQRRLGAARWRTKRWIVCTLVPRHGPREVMTPGRYTELFFLDEATALAAGHRPCAECRREAFLRFASAFGRASGLDRAPAAPEMDRLLHEARPTMPGHRPTIRATLGQLPDGTFVQRQGDAWLVKDGRLLRWSFDGYGPPMATSPHEELAVLTPAPSLSALRLGYRPILHPSAEVRTHCRFDTPGLDRPGSNGPPDRHLSASILS